MSNNAHFPLLDQRVWVAGHRGMVGSAIIRALANEGCEVITAERAEADLTIQDEVDNFISTRRPSVIFMAAAKVGGILANASYPADFLYQNLMIASNVTASAHRHGVRKMLFLGSSCIYPRMAEQPIHESALLTGPLEPTNEWYAIAKISGIKLAQAYRKQHGSDFISAMPTNLYGPGDNYDAQTSHVLPALIRRFHDAKISGDRSVTIWGTGTPLREFLHADDCAQACIHLMKNYSGYAHINVGSGAEVSILELAKIVAEIVGYTGEILTDPEKPDGTPRKLLNSSTINDLGWKPKISLSDGIQHAYACFNEANRVR